jgi:dTDP-4-amino-4,6-dideoxygalactose transaminase
VPLVSALARETAVRIPVFVPHIGVDTLKHLTDAFDAGWLGMGASTKEFEDRIAAYLGLEDRYVVATNTGTAALHIALLAAGVGPGDEVITPSFNYVADHQAITMTGAQVVMCDILEENFGIDCDKAASVITPRTKAIIPLHFSGIPCKIADVYELAKRHNLRVVEDACHSFGSTVNQKKIGSFGDIAAFSFDPVKIITSIDGGCVVVSKESEVTDLHHFRLLGVDKDTTERYKNRRAWEYDVVSPGFRYHLTNIMASVGISQIKRVDEFIESRRTVCKAYNEAFSEFDAVRVPQTDFEHVSPFIYSLRVLNGRREAFVQHMNEREIDVGIHFVPVHKHTYFSGSRRSDMSITDRIVEEVVTLPLHSNMKPEFVERVIEGVESFCKS